MQGSPPSIPSSPLIAERSSLWRFRLPDHIALVPIQGRYDWQI